ncbi:hypothetical protein EWM64_g7002 [Hericium alpestre]|uniref:Uncharacterized protein n=1 Tax=Hericium alpestre TaxID=135208 RepID=A0A4Y9ZS02_9AGAM|nr:hypothetical protein EWM64_g7002 [Hericium alpestre]
MSTNTTNTMSTMHAGPALARDVVRCGEAKSDPAGCLGCFHQVVSKAVHNEYRIPDDLDDDADYLCGELGELVDLDELENNPAQLKQFGEDKKDEIKFVACMHGRMPAWMPSVTSSGYELTSAAMLVDDSDGNIGSDSDGEFSNDTQPQEH